MRVALLPTAIALLTLTAGIMTFACSSSSPAAAEEPTPAPTPVPQQSAPVTNNEPAAEQAPVADTDAAPAADAGPADPGVGTTEGDGGSRCQAGSIRESEPNNELAAADKLEAKSLTFCGRITAGDVDFFTFTMPEQVGDFSFNLDPGSTTNMQAIKVEPSADGEPFNFFGEYPFKPGKPYVFKISSKGGTFDYRMKITLN